jgi:quercetin dioxygenase-like cupin family protein
MAGISAVHSIREPDVSRRARMVRLTRSKKAIKLMSNRDLSEVSDPEKASIVQFWRASPGFTNDWHPAPARQYNIRLTGRAEVELSGGKKIRLGPGQIVLVEDVTGRGHITKESSRVALEGMTSCPTANRSSCWCSDPKTKPLKLRSDQINITLNWFEELKERLPSK